jgi:hypothetical protein
MAGEQKLRVRRGEAAGWEAGAGVGVGWNRGTVGVWSSARASRGRTAHVVGN